MDKYLLVDLEIVDRVKVQRLLDALLDATESDGKLINCLAIRAHQGVLDTMKEFFGGSVVITIPPGNEHLTSADKAFIGSSPITLPSPAETQIVKGGPVSTADLSAPFKAARDQINKDIDGKVNKLEIATFPARRKKPKPEPKQRREIRSWHVILIGQKVEAITISEKDRRLMAGEFEPETYLSHPKAGKQKVIGEKGMHQTLVPA